MPAGSQVWLEPLKQAVGNGAAITAAAEALIYPDYSVPAGYFSKSGQFIRFEIRGIITTPASAPGTITLRVRWGGLAGTILAASPAMVPVVSKTNVGWTLRGKLIVRAANIDSATGLSLMCQGDMDSEAITGGYGALVQPTPGTVVSSLDGTIAKLLSFTYQPSAATLSLTTTEYGLEHTATP